MPDIIKSFHINASRKEDARILSKLNSVVPYMYKDAHKCGRIFMEQALDDFIGRHNIDWSQYLPAVGR